MRWSGSGPISPIGNRSSLDGVESEGRSIECGVPQGSILGPLLFSLSVNDVTHAVRVAKIVLYADDTAIYFKHASVEKIKLTLSEDFKRVSEWLELNKLTLNAKKTKCMLFGTPNMLSTTAPLALSHGTDKIEQVASFKYLGVTLDSKLNFEDFIDEIARKVASRIAVLGRVRRYLPVRHRVMLFNTLVLPHFDYASIVWSNTHAKHLNRLIGLQRRASRVIMGLNSSDEAMDKLKWTPVDVRWSYQRAVTMFKVAHGLAPSYLSDKFKSPSESRRHGPVTRGQTTKNFEPSASVTNWGRRRLASHGVFIWNNLPGPLKLCAKLHEFKTQLKFLIRQKFNFYEFKS